jgi:hypothetical protein
MFKKTFLFSAVTVIVAMMSVATASALNDTWNRPNPLMDYVPQEKGMYDTRYDRLTESDCRDCHGDSLTARHHYAPLGLARQCDACHDLISEPPGVIPIADCMTGGCHSWDDVYVNGWHHNTDLSAADNCVICHDPNLVAEITPFSGFQQYPPSVVTPTPFSCEDCHWGQSVVDAHALFDGTLSTQALAGHPSTYDHKDEWGQFIGYHEYSKEIWGNHDTHHMGNRGYVTGMCDKCHANDPNGSEWDTDDPELIRYCEICHDVSTLHAIRTHIDPPGTIGGPAVEGWEAAGFHVAGSSSDFPIVYRGDNADGFSTNPFDFFEANEMCFGCHIGGPVPPNPGGSLAIPVLDGVSPNSISPASLVELRGSNFGDIRTPGEDGVYLKGPSTGGAWQADVGVTYSNWSDDLIIIEIKAWDLAPGNYNVRVFNEAGTSPKKTFTIYDCISPQEIVVNNDGNWTHSNAGPCTATIKLKNPTGTATFGFGNAQDQSSKGVYGVVQVATLQGDYIVKNYRTWNPSLVKFRFKRFFEDLDGDFLQDANEPDILNCEGLAPDTHSVNIKYVFYIDNDTSGGYTDGDSIARIETSMPVTFELTNEPYITALKPNQRAKGSRVRILGVNFGDNQAASEIRIGTRKQYKTDPFTKGLVMNRVRLWGDNKVVVRLKAKDAWQGTTKYIWVVKDGMVSNYKKVEILAPAP